MINKNIKLVAIDMDGTLLDSEKRLPEDFEAWVSEHKEIQTVIASGRQYFTLRQMFPELADRLTFVAENGGIVFRNGKMLYANSISKEDMRWCIEYFEGDSAAQVLLCGAKAAYMKHTSERIEQECDIYYKRIEFVDSLYDALWKDEFIKLAIFYENEQVRSAQESIIKGLPTSLECVISGKNWMDIANISSGKGAAVEAIQKEFNISREESMAFGDYLNDYTLLKSCEESYAMANAQPELKEIAKYIAESNDDDGVMKVLRQLK